MAQQTILHFKIHHTKPKGFLAHNSIDDDLICLGSWVGLNNHVPAVRK